MWDLLRAGEDVGGMEETVWPLFRVLYPLDYLLAMVS